MKGGREGDKETKMVGQSGFIYVFHECDDVNSNTNSLDGAQAGPPHPLRSEARTFDSADGRSWECIVKLVKSWRDMGVPYSITEGCRRM